MGLQREILLLGAKEEIVRAYFKFMVDVAEIFGADRKKAQEELSDSIFFEIQLAKVRFKKISFYNLLTLHFVFLDHELARGSHS